MIEPPGPLNRPVFARGAGRSAPSPLTIVAHGPYLRVERFRASRARRTKLMKIKNSLRSLKERQRDTRLVRRKGRVYIINKTQKRYKARQG